MGRRGQIQREDREGEVAELSVTLAVERWQVVAVVRSVGDTSILGAGVKAAVFTGMVAGVYGGGQDCGGAGRRDRLHGELRVAEVLAVEVTWAASWLCLREGCDSGLELVINEAVALKFHALKNLIDDDFAGSASALPNVTSNTLTKVLEWCVRHIGEVPEPDSEMGVKEVKELKELDAEYVNLDETTVFELILQRVYNESKDAAKAKEEALEFNVYNQGMFKTELCNKWEETGECPYMDHCQFAHGIGKLRRVTRHPRYKPEICRMILTSQACPYSHRCHFLSFCLGLDVKCKSFSF